MPVIVARSSSPFGAELGIGIEAYRRLACSVIKLALEDLHAPGPDNANRASARTFFEKRWPLVHWCSIAAIDPTRVVRYARTLRATHGENRGNRSFVEQLISVRHPAEASKGPA